MLVTILAIHVFLGFLAFRMSIALQHGVRIKERKIYDDYRCKWIVKPAVYYKPSDVWSYLIFGTISFVVVGLAAVYRGLATIGKFLTGPAFNESPVVNKILGTK